MATNAPSAHADMATPSAIVATRTSAEEERARRIWKTHLVGPHKDKINIKLGDAGVYTFVADLPVEISSLFDVEGLLRDDAVTGSGKSYTDTSPTTMRVKELMGGRLVVHGIHNCMDLKCWLARHVLED